MISLAAAGLGEGGTITHTNFLRNSKYDTKASDFVVPGAVVNGNVHTTATLRYTLDDTANQFNATVERLASASSFASGGGSSFLSGLESALAGKATAAGELANGYEPLALFLSYADHQPDAAGVRRAGFDLNRQYSQQGLANLVPSLARASRSASTLLADGLSWAAWLEDGGDIRAAVAASGGSAYANLSADACRSLYLWARPLYYHGDLDGDSGYSDLRENLYGGSVGAAWRRDRLTLGLSGHFMHSDFDGGRVYDADYDGYGFNLGGAYRFDAGGFQPLLSVALGYTRYEVDQSRKTPLSNVIFPGSATAYSSEPDADVYTASLMLANRFRAGSSEWTPEMGADFAHTRLHGFGEKGNSAAAPYAMRVSGERVTSVQGVLGVRYAHHFTTCFSLSAKAQYRHEFADKKATLSYRYGDGAAPVRFSVDGQDAGRSSGVLGLGAKYRVGDRAAIGLDYDLHLAKKYVGHQFSATLTLAF